MDWELRHQNEMRIVRELRDELIARHDEWKASPMAENRWWKLLVGEHDLEQFYVAFKYLLNYWLDKEVIRVGGLLKLDKYHQVWQCLPDVTKETQPEIVALLDRFLNNPYAMCCGNTMVTRKGAVDISCYFERFLDVEVVNDYEYAIKKAKEAA